MSNSTKKATATRPRASAMWAAIGALSVAVVALASALYFVQTREAALRLAAVAPVATPAPAPAASMPSAVPSSDSEEKAAVDPAKQEPFATKSVANQAPTSAPGGAVQRRAAMAEGKVGEAPEPAVPMAREVCLNCGTVTAVTPVEREGTPSGAGAVAGNVVEKKMKKVTVYQVQLRMDDGSPRALEQAGPAHVGERVRVEGDTLQPLAPAN